uniref:Uncharacterized protein n=1 Tax=Opuntia streptacantha TaxID=393608 RepID=A0A7C9AF59_OPUST
MPTSSSSSNLMHVNHISSIRKANMLRDFSGSKCNSQSSGEMPPLARKEPTNSACSSNPETTSDSAAALRKCTCWDASLYSLTSPTKYLTRSYKRVHLVKSSVWLNLGISNSHKLRARMLLSKSAKRLMHKPKQHISVSRVFVCLAVSCIETNIFQNAKTDSKSIAPTNVVSPDSSSLAF